MKRLLAIYDQIEEKLLVVSLAVNVLIIFMQVVMRSVFNSSISWSEELARYIFIWQIWLGASIAYRSQAHIKVELIFNLVTSPRFRRYIEIIVDSIWLAFSIFLLVEGIQLLQNMVARNVLSAGMRLPLVYVYAALPVSSFFISLRVLIGIIEKIKSPIASRGEEIKEG